MMFPWGDERRFNAYSRYCKAHFGGRVQRLPVDAGFSCPNRLDRLHGGCTYCANNAFSPSYLDTEDSVAIQLERGKAFFQKRYPHNQGYLAYFQAYTNTYASLPILKEKFESALQVSDTRGLVISTRPDCLPDEVLDYLSELSLHTELFVELGVESFRNETLDHIHRGHAVEQTYDAIGKLSERKIPVCLHLIFGLPFETPSQWMEDVQILNRLPIQFMKFHQLQIFKNTAMAAEYAEHPERFHAFTAEEYIRFICDYLERMSPEIIVERFSAEVPPRYLAVSNWHLLRHDAIVRAIEAELDRRGAWQGCKC